jgi:hypothetical protein
MDTSYVAVAVVTSRTEAELIAGLLRSNGLKAAVSADDAGGQDPQLQILGVRVLVAPADEAAARQVIADAQPAERIKIIKGLGELRVTTEGWLCCLGVNAKARS